MVPMVREAPKRWDLCRSIGCWWIDIQSRHPKPLYGALILLSPTPDDESERP